MRQALDRDFIGYVVRQARVHQTRRRGGVPPSELLPYDHLAEPEKEVERCVGEAVCSALWAITKQDAG